MRGVLFSQRGKHIGINKVIFLVSFLVLGLYLIAVLPSMIQSYNRYSHAKETFALSLLTDDLFQAVRHFGFERGRVNVVLSNTGNVTAMESNRQFIENNRAVGNLNLTHGLIGLRAFDISGISAYLDTVEASLMEVDVLRGEVQREMNIEYTLRSPLMRQAWFPAMNKLIASIEDLLFHVYVYISEESSKNGLAFKLKMAALSLRDSAGPECSFMIAANANKSAVTRAELE